MTNFLRSRWVAAPAVAVAVLVGTSACSQTKGPGTVETPAGSCIPSESTFKVKEGDSLNVAVADLSHDKKWSDRVYSEDYMGVNVEDGEVVFSDSNDTKYTEIKRIGVKGDGLPYYTEWSTNRVDLSALEEGDPYRFAVREADKELKVEVTVEEDGQVELAFTQDCDTLPRVN